MAADGDETDKRLIRRFLEHRSSEALNQLITRHVSPVKSLLRKLGCGAEDVDDLCQDVLVRAVRSLASFRGESAFRSWLYAIAVNVVRSNRSRQTFGNPQDLAVEEIVDPQAELPWMRMSRAEAVQQLHAAIQELTDTQREAIVFSLTQEMTARDAAQLCGCSVNAFHVRVHEARKALKSKMSRVLNES